MSQLSAALSAVLLVLATLTVAHGQGEPATPAPGTLLGVIDEGTVNPFEIQRLATPLFGRHGPPIVENAARSYRIRYETVGLDGEAAEVVAQLFVPVLPNAADRPLLVFGSGTTGLDDSCAPSRESLYPRRLGDYRANLLTYAGRGITAVIPDYLGFNDPERLQSYFNAEAEARVMLDAARAVEQFFVWLESNDSGATVAGSGAGLDSSDPEEPLAGSDAELGASHDSRDPEEPITGSGAELGASHDSRDPGDPPGLTSGTEERSVFFGGYSQGGHAAFAAADLASSYAPELEVEGIIGFGSTTDVETLLREGPYYAPYIVLSYAQDYGPDLVPAGKIFRPEYLASLSLEAGKVCVDVAQVRYPFDAARLYRSEFLMALHGHSLGDYVPGFASLLTNNRTGVSGHGLPALIVQGNADIIISTDSQTAFVRELCGHGSEVLYLRLPGVRHRETRPAGFDESVAWIKARDSGQPTPSSCSLLEDVPGLTPSVEGDGP